uniref:Uncharacterized protein n=1 Tax=Anguilla anguilla TaxID=7936 RepID=A0A0E9SWD4_ANGAN
MRNCWWFGGHWYGFEWGRFPVYKLLVNRALDCGRAACSSRMSHCSPEGNLMTWRD